MGFKRVVVVAVGLVLAVAGVAIGGYFESASHGLRPYSLQETLPKMVAAFGSNARVVEIIVGSSDVYFQVIGADRQLHIRDYAVVESEIEAGTYGYNRKTRDYVRAPSAAESRGAVLTLGQIDPSVVGKLYDKVGFPRQGSSATLTGRSWFLESGASPDHQYVAAYDGRGLASAQSSAPPDPNAPATSPAVSAAPSGSSTSSKASTTAVFHFTTTISSRPTSPRKLHAAQRLVACIEHAQGDVNKIAACQRRFVP
jgi:hypothetical protein